MVRQAISNNHIQIKLDFYIRYGRDRMECIVCNTKMEFHMVAKKGFFYKCPKCGLSEKYDILSKDGKESKYFVIDEDCLK